MDISYSDSELLKFIASHPVEASKCIDANDKIDLAQIQVVMMLDERKKLLEQHPFEIGYHRKKGLYYTYFLDPSKKSGRRQVCRKNRSDLEDLIIEQVKEGNAITIADVFEDFLQRKVQNDGIKDSTVHRYRNVFKRHYSSTEWSKRDIRKIDAESFADFIEDEIGRCNLDHKALANLKGITTGILRRASKRHLISFTPSMVYDFVDVSPRKKLVCEQDQIITEKELGAFISYLIEHQTVQNLALLFMVTSGVRVGEMTTLKFTDFISPTSFKVQRTETFYKKGDKWVYEVADRTKTVAGNRTAFIPEQFSWVVEKLRRLHPFAEFLCSDDDNNRIRSYSLRNHLYGICRKLPEFQKEKSTHKLRKTFCSILLDSGFDENLITSIMGHTDISTSECFYHFDRKTDDKKQEMLNNIVEFQVS